MTERESAWEEGSAIINLKGLLGLEIYKQGIENGDIEERMNSSGKLMAYQKKEKVSGKRQSMRSTKSVEKSMEIGADDFAKFAGTIANEAKA